MNELIRPARKRESERKRAYVQWNKKVLESTVKNKHRTVPDTSQIKRFTANSQLLNRQYKSDNNNLADTELQRMRNYITFGLMLSRYSIV